MDELKRLSGRSCLGRRRRMCIVLVVALAGAPGSSAARQLHFPSIPVPQAILKGAITQQISTALGKTIADEAPIEVVATDAYPTIAVLPGRPFAPGAGTPVLQRLHDGTLLLAPGDYQFSVATFCMKATSHSPNGNQFTLAPLRGKLADVIAAVHARGTAAGVPHSDVQTLSWQLQAGLKYEELGARSQALVDRFIPEDRARLNESYLEKIGRTWATLAATIPGAPTLDSSLDRLGDAGRAVRELEFERAQLLADANDYAALSRTFAQVAAKPGATNTPTPWSAIGRFAYARLLNTGSYTGPGTYQVRILAATQVALPALVAAASPVGLGPAPASEPLPVAGQVGIPNGAVQPLAIAPDPNALPLPAQAPPWVPDCSTPAYGGGVDGVPNGTTPHPFDSSSHPGTDVSAGRGTPVYLDIEPSVSAQALSGPYYHSGNPLTIPETGDLTLVDATVTQFPFPGNGTTNPDDWGGVLRINARYRGTSGATYTVAIDYLHLITPQRMPRDNVGRWIDKNGNPIRDPSKYRGCDGFGPQMTSGARLPAAEIAKHPLIGYLGATQSSHVHIQASYQNLYFNPQPFLESQP